MKILAAISLLICLATPAYTQDAGCNAEVSKTVLDQLVGGRQIYQSFRIDGKGGNVETIEFNVVMREGHQYHFNLYNESGGADGIVMKIYSRRTKERMTDNLGGGATPSTTMVYTCTETGLYDLRFSFKGSKNYCGVCISSFSK